RLLYRYELNHPSLWCALQAIEKYLKAILLYNRQSTINIRHNIEEALRRVKSISDLNFTVPEDVENFIKYLNYFGQDRYLVQEFIVPEDYLLKLDKTVWYLRRYCYYLRGEKNGISMLHHNLKWINDPEFIEKPWKYEFPPGHKGYLEKIKEKDLPSKEALLWNNNYFAEPTSEPTSFKKRILIKESPLELHPECLEILRSLVYIPRQINDN
ncbi:MAG: HEPN domain-containing protein, partial [Thermodesulfobacteria bacterium]|nr:HEPN domain-containing protein [Thermodesulfobacteriota bacterium]